jgi:DNA 3'-phosphatase
VKEYNFVAVSTKPLETGLDVKAVSIGAEGSPFFEFGTRIQTSVPHESNRRKLLVAKDALKPVGGKVKVAFFDADSTLRIAKSGNLSANGPDDVILLPGVAEKLAALAKDGYLIAIVSNQNGVSNDFVSFGGEKTFEGKFQIADLALQYAIELIRKENGDAIVGYYDFAEGAQGDYFHKPNVGMGKQLERVLAKEGLEIDWTASFMVGDSQYKEGELAPDGRMGDAASASDREFAENLGIRQMHPQQLFGWSDRLRAAIVNHDPVALAKAVCERKMTEK